MGHLLVLPTEVGSDDNEKKTKCPARTDSQTPRTDSQTPRTNGQSILPPGRPLANPELLPAQVANIHVLTDFNDVSMASSRFQGNDFIMKYDLRT